MTNVFRRYETNRHVQRVRERVQQLQSAGNDQGSFRNVSPSSCLNSPQMTAIRLRTFIRFWIRLDIYEAPKDTDMMNCMGGKVVLDVRAKRKDRRR